MFPLFSVRCMPLLQAGLRKGGRSPYPVLSLALLHRVPVRLLPRTWFSLPVSQRLSSVHPGAGAALMPTAWPS